MCPDTGCEWKIALHEKLCGAESLDDLSFIYQEHVLPNQPSKLYHYSHFNGHKDKDPKNNDSEKIAKFIQFLSQGAPMTSTQEYCPLKLSNPDYYNDPFDTTPNVSNGPDDLVKRLEAIRDGGIPKFLVENRRSSDDCNFDDIDLRKFKTLPEGVYELWEHCFRSIGFPNPDVNAKKWTEKFMEDVVEGMKDEEIKFKKNVRICCFSEDYNSILMWSHYGGDHTGVCLEYDIYSLDPKKDIGRGRLFPVLYLKTPKDMTHRLDTDREQVRGVALLHTSLIKSIEWSYEHEWRLVCSLDDNKAAFPLPKLTTIYIGYRMDDKMRDAIIVEAKKQGICVKKMYPNFGKYEIIAGRNLCQ